jgi:hypothetical protein
MIATRTSIDAHRPEVGAAQFNWDGFSTRSTAPVLRIPDERVEAALGPVIGGSGIRADSYVNHFHFNDRRFLRKRSTFYLFVTFSSTADKPVIARAIRS